MQDIPCRVWVFRNDGTVAEADLALLSDEERMQGARLKVDADRAAFIKTRAALRRVLGQAIGRSPAAISFERNAWGKPLLDATARGQIDFSVAHAKGLSVIALGQRASVGIDVEPTRSCPDRVRIAADVFGLEVAQQLLRVERTQQDVVFLRLWTAGEAFVKACGLGFAGMNGKVPVRLSATAPLQVTLREDMRRRWVLSSLELGPEFAGHVVVGRGADSRAGSQSIELRSAAGLGSR
jgi:4'-phosphopantetheinyl transferase